MKLLNVFFTVLLAAQTGAAQSVAFKITPPSKKPKLAEPFKVSLEASCPGDYGIKLDTTSIDGEFFELLGVKELSSKTAGGTSTAVFEFEAAAFTLGISTFPEMTFRLSGGGQAMEAKSPPFTIEIEPLFEKAKAGQPAEIKDIYPPLRFIPWFWLIAGLLAACAFAAFLYSRRKKAAAETAVETPKDTRTPYRRAVDSLETLAASGLWEEGKIKEFYIGFSGIFRLYIREQFSIDALSMTTAGLSKELKKTGADVQTLISSRELLERSDLVKFAKFRPQQKDSDLAALKEILARLTPAPAPEPETPKQPEAGDGAQSDKGGGK